MSKKTKILFGAIILLVLVLGAGLIVLAKTGKLSLLANQIKGRIIPKTSIGGNITLKVRDSNHNRLGYEVEASGIRVGDNFELPPQTTHNSDATYSNLNPGSYIFRAAKDNGCYCYTSDYPFTIQAGQNHQLEMTLNCSDDPDTQFKIYGSIKSTTNQRLNGIKILLYDAASNYLEAEISHNISDLYNFSLDNSEQDPENKAGYSPGRYRLLVNQEGVSGYNSNYETKEIIRDMDGGGIGKEEVWVILSTKDDPANKFTLMGTIKDKDNSELISGAEITVEGKNNFKKTTQSTSQYETGDFVMTNYHITDLYRLNDPNNFYSIKIEKNGYQTINNIVLGAETGTNFLIKNYVLIKNTNDVQSCIVTGKVLSNKGQPIEVARVSLYQVKDDNFLELINPIVATDNHGDYIKSVGVGENIIGHKYTLKAAYDRDGINTESWFVNNMRNDAQNSLFGTQYFIAENGVMNNMNIVLNIDPSQNSIFGRAVKAENRDQGLANTKITVIGDNNYTREVMTDESGHYILLSLVGGNNYFATAEYQTEKSEDTRSITSRSFWLGKNARLEINFVLAKNPNYSEEGRITGTVTLQSNSKPISGVEVKLFKMATKQELVSTHTNSEGKYYFRLDSSFNNNANPNATINLMIVLADINYYNQPSQFGYYKKITIKQNSGQVIRVDFKIQDIKQETDVKNINITAVEAIQDSSGGISVTDKKVQNANIKLVYNLDQPYSEASISQIAIPSQKTDKDGKVVFFQVPKIELFIRALKPGYFQRQIIQISANQENATVVLVREQIDIRKAAQKIKLFQGDVNQYFPAEDYKDEVESRAGNSVIIAKTSIAGGGCCLTSFAIALKYIYDTDMEPNLVATAGRNRHFSWGEDLIPAAQRVLDYNSPGRFVIQEGLNWQQIEYYVNQKGWPVVAHFNNPTVAGHGGEHCVLIVRVNPNGTFSGVDPNPVSPYSTKSNPIFTYPKIRINHSAVIKPRNNQPIIVGNTGDLKKDINQNNPYQQVIRLSFNSIFQAGNVTVKTRITNQDYSFPAKKIAAGSWQFEIPCHLINSNFSYSVLVDAETGQQINLGQVDVTVTPVEMTLKQQIKRWYSIIRYKITVIKNQTAINNALTAFNNWLLGVWGKLFGTKETTEFSGYIYDLNNQPVNGYIKVGPHISRIESGNFSISKITIGEKPIIIYDGNTRSLIQNNGQRQNKININSENNTINLQINETLSQPENINFGYLDGSVKSETGQALAYLILKIGNRIVRTDGNGYFIFKNLDLGTINVVASDPVGLRDKICGIDYQIIIKKAAKSHRNIRTVCQPGSLSGTVYSVDSANQRKPLSNAYFLLDSGQQVDINNDSYNTGQIAPISYNFQIIDKTDGYVYTLVAPVPSKYTIYITSGRNNNYSGFWVKAR